MNDNHLYSESWLRRLAYKQGLRIHKRHNSYIDYDGYMICDLNTNSVVFGGHFELDLEDVQIYLTED